jgi:alpha-D-xyloside xylohydrolase
MRPHAGGVHTPMHRTGRAGAPEAEGRGGGILLGRSDRLGARRPAAVVRSSDVHSTLPDLARRAGAGLDMAMSGIAWWTTDVGGLEAGTSAARPSMGA